MDAIELLDNRRTSRKGWRVAIWSPIFAIKFSERSTLTRMDPRAVWPVDQAVEEVQSGGEKSKHEVRQFFFAFNSMRVGKADKEEMSAILLLEMFRYMRCG
jgi:hypothetical protein